MSKLAKTLAAVLVAGVLTLSIGVGFAFWLVDQVRA
jgi:hypothetical protein